jgi:integrase
MPKEEEFPKVVKFTQANVRTLAAPPDKADWIVWDEALPRFGIRFRNGGPGTYIVEYDIAGKTRRLSIDKVKKTDLEAAKKKAKAYFGQVADDKDPHAERAKAIARIEGAVSFLSKVDDHIAWQRSEDRSDSHIDGVTRTLKEYSKTLHAIDVADIKSGHISPVLSAIRSGRGKAAARNSRAHLSKYFSWPRGEGLVEYNPVSGTNKDATVERERVLEPWEIKMIWEALPDGDYGKVVKLLLLNTCRRSEMGDLKRSEITWDGGYIDLPGRHTIKKRRKQKAAAEAKKGRQTKNRQRFLIPLTGPTIAILKSVPEVEGRDFVFGRTKNGSFTGWSKAKAELDATLDKDFEHWVLHDFRHTFRTLAKSLGIDDRHAEMCLEHTIPGVEGTYNHYAYFNEKKDALDKWATYVQSCVSGERKSHLRIVGGIAA